MKIKINRYVPEYGGMIGEIAESFPLISATLVTLTQGKHKGKKIMFRSWEIEPFTEETSFAA